MPRSDWSRSPEYAARLNRPRPAPLAIGLFDRYSERPPECRLGHDSHAVLPRLLGLAGLRVGIGDHEEVESLGDRRLDHEAGLRGELLGQLARDPLTLELRA